MFGLGKGSKVTFHDPVDGEVVEGRITEVLNRWQYVASWEKLPNGELTRSAVINDSQVIHIIEKQPWWKR